MSILIRGMEMPHDENDSIHILRDGMAIVYRSESIDLYKAIPVPSHGRLIDADALVDSFDPSDFWNPDAEDNCFAAIHVVNCAPTIIPAEEPMHSNASNTLNALREECE